MKSAIGLVLGLIALWVAGCALTQDCHLWVDGRQLGFELSYDWTRAPAGRGYQVWRNRKIGSQLAGQARSEKALRQTIKTRLAQAPESELTELQRQLKPVATHPIVKRALTKGLPEAVAELQKIPFDPDEEASLRVRLWAYGVATDQVEFKQITSGLQGLVGPGGLYFLWSDHLVIFTSENQEVLTRVASTLDLNRPQVAQNSPREVRSQQPSPRGHGDSWLRMLFSPYLFYLFLVAIPAYLGALTGYASSDDPKKGAARGAGNAVFYTLLLCTLVATVGILVWSAGQPSGSGVMTTFVFGIVVFVIGLPAGALLSACMGLMAGVFAYQGARQGPHLAGIAAAIGAPLGIALMGLLLSLASGKSRRDYSGLPPTNLVACSGLSMAR